MSAPQRTHATASNSQQRTDKVIDIKSRWGVSDTEFDMIRGSFEEILKELGVLGKRIQGMAARSTVTKAIDRMMRKQRHRNILGALDPERTHSDLRHMALLLSRNYRKKLGRDMERETRQQWLGTALSNEGNSPESLDRYTRKQPVKTPGGMCNEPALVGVHDVPTERVMSGNAARRMSFCLQTRKVIVQREDGREARIYRIQDFSSRQSTETVLELDDLNYEDFMNTLDTDFRTDRDVLTCYCEEGVKIIVSSEKVWKAALSEMFDRNERHFKFTLEPRADDS